MAEELLTRILREVRERLEQSRQAVDESQRLEAALDALEAERKTPRGSVGRARRGPTRPRSAQPRARRGESQARILQVVGERPGVSAAEISASTGVARNTVTTTLQRLTSKQRVTKVELPSGGVGFQIPEPLDKPDEENIRNEEHSNRNAEGDTTAQAEEGI